VLKGERMENKGSTVMFTTVCSCCGWQKGMSWDEVTSSSEEIKPIARSIAELHVCLAEGIS